MNASEFGIEHTHAGLWLPRWLPHMQASLLACLYVQRSTKGKRAVSEELRISNPRRTHRSSPVISQSCWFVLQPCSISFTNHLPRSLLRNESEPCSRSPPTKVHGQAPTRTCSPVLRLESRRCRGLWRVLLSSWSVANLNGTRLWCCWRVPRLRHRHRRQFLTPVPRRTDTTALSKNVTDRLRQPHQGPLGRTLTDEPTTGALLDDASRGGASLVHPLLYWYVA